jgi:acetoin utilization protein AcuB
MRIKEQMTKTVVFFEPEESIESAYLTMKYLGCRHLPVAQDGYLVGIISDRDILLHSRAENGAVSVADMAIEDMMSIKVITIYEDESVEVAANKMLKFKIDALPVLRRDGTLSGIITSTDLLKLIGDEGIFKSKLPYNFHLKPFSEMNLSA